MSWGYKEKKKQSTCSQAAHILMKETTHIELSYKSKKYCVAAKAHGNACSLMSFLLIMFPMLNHVTVRRTEKTVSEVFKSCGC